jgi:hypothetical protein
MISAGPEPGWYFDPDGGDHERYWNGEAWTEHRRSKPLTFNPPPQPESKTRLRSVATSFLGRESQLAELKTAVGAHRLVTLTGVRGMGKTRLALGVCREDRCVALGCENRQGRFDDVMLLVGDQLPAGSIYRLLADYGAVLFGDDYFGDLFKHSTRGRPTVPARVVATVMVLQAYEGLSDREACDRLAFDLRWKAAAGLTVAAEAFHPTVLVGMRNRLRGSERPRRLFDDVTTTAREAGLLRGRRRVIDSTPLFDAVATQDTVIQLRAAIRKVLSAADRADPGLASVVRAALTRDDDYATLGKPPCDWDDPKARDALVDALVRDARAALAALDGHDVEGPLAPAAELLALVAGQDVEQDDDGCFASPGGWPGIG